MKLHIGVLFDEGETEATAEILLSDGSSVILDPMNGIGSVNVEFAGVDHVKVDTAQVTP